MKKTLSTVSAMIVLLSLLIVQSCKKDDTTPPVVTLSGSSSQTISLNSSYTDPGATANDDEDGTITTVTSDVSSTNPNVNLAGTYIITYSASDGAGNVGTASRTVIVQNDAAYLAGTYLTTEGAATPWQQTITASTTVNNRIHFSEFASYLNNTGIYAAVNGSTVELPSAQNGVNIGLSGCTHTFTPQTGGAPITGLAGSYTFSIKFTDQQLAGGASCPATGAVPYEDVFVQQ